MSYAKLRRELLGIITVPSEAEGRTKMADEV